jgi:hypothetical protein
MKPSSVPAAICWGQYHDPSPSPRRQYLDPICHTPWPFTVFPSISSYKPILRYWWSHCFCPSILMAAPLPLLLLMLLLLLMMLPPLLLLQPLLLLLSLLLLLLVLLVLLLLLLLLRLLLPLLLLLLTCLLYSGLFLLRSLV